MNPSDLDDLLSSTPARLPAALEDEAQRVAHATMPGRLRRGRAPRSRWTAPLVVAGLLVLTAGTGTAAITMSHWGHVSMPLENLRNEDPIRVNWTTESGHEENCRVWIEVRNSQLGDQLRLDDAVAARDWSGLGQRLYDTATVPASGDEDGEERVAGSLSPLIREFASETFPGIHWLLDGASTDARGVEAWGMNCAPETR